MFFKVFRRIKGSTLPKAQPATHHRVLAGLSKRWNSQVSSIIEKGEKFIHQKVFTLLVSLDEFNADLDPGPHDQISVL